MSEFNISGLVFNLEVSVGRGMQREPRATDDEFCIFLTLQQNFTERLQF